MKNLWSFSGKHEKTDKLWEDEGRQRRMMRVIVADDEPLIRMDLREILEKQGYEVVAEAADGFDVVECCKREHPDLVIMDVKMPLLDGITAAKIIGQEKLAQTVVLLTAYCDREFIEDAKEANVAGYFVKPVNEKTFLPGLEIAVERSRKMAMLEKEYEHVNERLERRTLVEQAKGLVMSQKGISEQEAYDYIRNVSRTKNISMKRVAEMILMRR